MIAYRIQEEAFGGLDRETIKLLDRLAKREKPNELNRRLKPGTVLVREYNGERHTVTVMPDGSHGGTRPIPACPLLRRPSPARNGMVRASLVFVLPANHRRLMAAKNFQPQNTKPVRRNRSSVRASMTSARGSGPWISLPKAAPRCAVYTRKSTDHNLDLEFNSLDAQREACEAYIKSQAHEGWRLIPDHYDDGAFSGSLARSPCPAKTARRIRANKVDVIVVYKVDRLTRSLSDFAKLVELFDQYSVSFVSVTQHFNTTSSMGRLTSTCCCHSPSSSARSSASGSATRSRLPKPRASGSVAPFR